MEGESEGILVGELIIEFESDGNTVGELEGVDEGFKVGIVAGCTDV